jgi:hypothetical protein
MLSPFARHGPSFSCLQWGINLFRRNASSLTTYTWLGSWRVPGSGAGIRFAAGRNNTAGQLIVVGTQCTAPYSLWHFNVSRAGA